MRRAKQFDVHFWATRCSRPYRWHQRPARSTTLNMPHPSKRWLLGLTPRVFVLPSCESYPYRNQTRREEIDSMLRVAGRRLAASLSWRPSCASSTFLSRTPIPGAASSDDDSRSHVVPSAGFHFESVLLRSIRGLVFLLSMRSFFIFASKDSRPVANE